MNSVIRLIENEKNYYYCYYGNFELPSIFVFYIFKNIFKYKYFINLFEIQIQNTSRAIYMKYKYMYCRPYLKYVFQIQVFQILPNTDHHQS